MNAAFAVALSLLVFGLGLPALYWMTYRMIMSAPTEPYIAIPDTPAQMFPKEFA